MQTIKLFRFLFLLLVPLTGCQEEKCVKVSDGHGKMIEKVDLKFSAIIERNEEKMGWAVTSLPPLYEVSVGSTNKNGEICFSPHKKEDSSYLYTKMRAWRFYTNSLETTYYDFDSIPSVVVLEKSPVPRPRIPIHIKSKGSDSID